MTATLLILIFGLGILIKGADLLIKGAVAVAEKLRISPLLIGLTIVAFGTSAPELGVNLVSAIKPETSDIGLGNIIGSNIANIGLILGLSALIRPLLVKRIMIAREIPFMSLSTAVFLVMVSDRFLNQAQENTLSKSDGVLLLIFFVIFLYYLTATVVSQRADALKEEFKKEYEKKKVSLLRGIIFISVGLVGLGLGSKLVVDNTVILAKLVGLSEIFIGLTIIALGTSLPELATSTVAAYRKEADIAIGNIVGSNIFNTFFVLGINAVISPVPFSNPEWFVDALAMIVFSLMLFALSLSGKIIKRWEGALLLTLYLGYVGYLISRG